MIDAKPITTALWNRLREGAEEYQNASFHRTPKSLAGEVLEELLDIVGWTAIAYIAKSGATTISRRDVDRFLVLIMSENTASEKDEYIAAMMRLSLMSITAWLEFATQWGIKPKRKKSKADRAAEAAQGCIRDCRRIFQAVGHEADDRELHELVMSALRPTLTDYVQDRIGESLGIVVSTSDPSTDDD